MIDAGGHRHPPGSDKANAFLLWLGSRTNTLAGRTFASPVFLNEAAFDANSPDDTPMILIPVR